jgi:hypothetical protein
VGHFYQQHFVSSPCEYNWNISQSINGPI